MSLSDFILLAVPAAYVVAAVTLGVLSNRLAAWMVTALSAATLASAVIVLCWDCFNPATRLVQSLTLVLLYFGVPLLAGYVVPFVIGRYVARVVFLLLRARHAKDPHTGEGVPRPVPPE
jgi:hypothetical protein